MKTNQRSGRLKNDYIPFPTPSPTLNKGIFRHPDTLLSETFFFTSGRFIACERELICAVTQVTRPARLGPASEASVQELGEGSFLFQYPCRALALLYCLPARH